MKRGKFYRCTKREGQTLSVELWNHHKLNLIEPNNYDNGEHSLTGY